METEELELLDEQEVDIPETETEDETAENFDADFKDDPFLCDECQRLGYCKKGREERMQERRIAELLRE